MAEVLRMMDLIAQMLAELVALRRTAGSVETRRRIAAMCLEGTGLPFDFVKKSAPAEILKLLKSGGAVYHIRAVLIAELLLQDAELNDTSGSKREAQIERAQAYILLSDSVDLLSSEEQASYQPKIKALAERLTEKRTASVLRESGDGRK
jgi:hypothetical protein